jgi:predicted NUDIX family NTP pyrophosphohydrolase
MPPKSSGLLLYRFRDSRLQVMLVHPGGPFWARKDHGAWSIPKGLIEETESPLAAARREFAEETGFEAEGEFVDLGETSLASGKVVRAFALQMSLDETRVTSNKFILEWPRGSGIIKQYPEIDRAAWFDINQAGEMIHKGQKAFLDRLLQVLNRSSEAEDITGEGADEDQQKAREQDHQEQSMLTRWSKE